MQRDDSDHANECIRARYRGCLLGGAVGDALGAPVEFMSRSQILHRFGPDGITGYASAYGGIGTITDDTQMTLFTAEGLIRAYVRGCGRGISSIPGVVAHAYLRWLLTQGEHPVCDVQPDGWLFGQRELHHARAPGLTCLSALRSMKSFGDAARNDSKGCGGVMRVAPVGLFEASLGRHDSPQQAFALGSELAALTHGHPAGQLTGGVLAVLVLALTGGVSMHEALTTAKSCLQRAPAHEETLHAIEQAERLAAARDLAHHDAVARLGEGWVADEALAISIYCALVASDFRHGVVLAVNHGGDSDSTGSITGNLLGARYGVAAIPSQWLDPLELRGVIEEMADDLFGFRGWDIGPDASDTEFDDRISRKYPSW